MVPRGWRDATCRFAAVSGRYLSFAEREEIASVRAQRLGVREIARRLGRSPSTISRELRRNAATRGGPLTTGHRPRSGTPNGAPGARSPPSLRPTTRLRAYVQDRLSGAVRGRRRRCAGPEVRWIGRRHSRAAGTGGGRRSWSPEQISNRLPRRLPG